MYSIVVKIIKIIYNKDIEQGGGLWNYLFFLPNLLVFILL